MAVRNIWNQNAKSFNMEDVNITHSFNLKEANYELQHVLNPDTGTYTIKNKLGNKLMEFDNNLELKPSALHNHIQQKEIALNDRIDGHEDRLLNIEQQFDPIAYQNGTTTGISYNLVSIGIENNKIGFIQGKVYFDNGCIEFIVYCKNVNNTVSIISWNLDHHYINSNKSLEFAINTTNIIIKLTNLTSNIKFRLAYDKDFMNL